jgi:hypothetical protein
MTGVKRNELAGSPLILVERHVLASPDTARR